MGRKIAVWVLAFCLLAAGGALIAGNMALSGVEKGEPLGITLYECGSEMDGIFWKRTVIPGARSRLRRC